MADVFFFFFIYLDIIMECAVFVQVTSFMLGPCVTTKQDGRMHEKKLNDTGHMHGV